MFNNRDSCIISPCLMPDEEPHTLLNYKLRKNTTYVIQVGKYKRTLAWEVPGEQLLLATPGMRRKPWVLQLGSQPS